MKNAAFGILLGLSFFLFSCRGGRTTGAAGSAATFQDFLGCFPPMPIPFSWGKDSLERDFPDSPRLDKASFAPYVADSLWHEQGRNTAIARRLYPVAAGRAGENNRLLMVEAVGAGSRRAYLLVYGEADTLVSALEVASVDAATPGHVFSFQLDEQGLIHINERKALPGGEVILRERVYTLGAGGSLTLILTNTNQPAAPGSFINPIDTLASIQPYSGDYRASASDLVSIRDGSPGATFRFFIHLDKQGGDCTGELEGVGRFTGSHTGEFSDDDGPCRVRFTFSRSQLVITEAGGCGAYRGVACYFEGVYKKQARRQEPLQ